MPGLNILSISLAYTPGPASRIHCHQLPVFSCPQVFSQPLACLVSWRILCPDYGHAWSCSLYSHILRTLYKILDSCRQLTLAQGAGEEDPSGMVTIITGLHLDNPSVLSGPMQVSHGRGIREESS